MLAQQTLRRLPIKPNAWNILVSRSNLLKLHLSYKNQHPLSRCFSLRRFKSTHAHAAAATNTDTTDADTKNDKDTRKYDRETNIRIFKTLVKYVWPTDTSTNTPQELQENRRLKQRVVGSLALMIGGKAVTIQVPFLFKYLIDALPSSLPEQSTSELLELSQQQPAIAVLPAAFVLGYGISRAASSGLQEARNAVFAHVAQDAIRNVGISIFHHVHTLDMQFHLSRNTGQVSRVLDRGQRSISFVLNALVFNVAPTLLEVGIVSGLMAYNFGAAHTYVVMTTVGT
jgi:ATP-binding cassette subfamily B (MDR/TAP) protein 7